MSQEVCDDHHICRNGSRCVPHPNFPGSYTCECSTDQEVYAGLSCDHVATSYCNDGNEVNAQSFCTNHGVCVDNFSEDGEHAGCICPEEYKGEVGEFIIPSNRGKHERNLTHMSLTNFYFLDCRSKIKHCEYTKYQSVPQNTMQRSSSSSSSSDSDNKALVATFSALAAFAVAAVLIAAFVLVKRRRNGVVHTTMSSNTIRQADSTQLDADGQVLHSSMRAIHAGELYSSSSSSPKKDTQVDNTDEIESGGSGDDV